MMGRRWKRGEAGGLAVRSAVLAGMVTLAGSMELHGQTNATKVPDAQVEANVLRALAGTKGLTDQHISTSAVYGVVTLSGSVKDEAARTMAEDVVSRTAGVKKVIDELTVGGSATAGGAGMQDGQPTVGDGSSAEEQTSGGATPQLHSDGTIAPAEMPANENNGATAEQSGGVPPSGAPDGVYGAGEAAPGSQGQQPGLPPSSSVPADTASRGVGPGGNGGYPQDGAAGPSNPQQPQGAPSYPQQPPYAQQGQGAQPPYPQQGPPTSPDGGQAPYGPPSEPRGRYGYPPTAPLYGVGGNGYAGQAAGQIVNLPAGTTLQVRLTQGLDSQHAQPGMRFTGAVARDVVSGGCVAIPRGAQVEGTVVDATRTGVLKGHASIALQLDGVSLGGRTYPLQSNVWNADGGDKTLRTVNSALGLGAVGAIVGAVAGGGAGAAIGAGVGGAAGIGSSAASRGPGVFLPPEAVVAFHLTQPTSVATVSQAEMQRLASGVPYGGTGLVRRYPPPPYYYRPGFVYYPRAYYRPYYRPYPY